MEYYFYFYCLKSFVFGCIGSKLLVGLLMDEMEFWEWIGLEWRMMYGVWCTYWLAKY